MEVLIAALSGLGINIAAAVGKKIGLSARHVVLTSCLLIGLGYAGFSLYVPSGIQEHIFSFVGIAMSTSWVVWEYAIPFLRGDGEEQE